jgi:hypothetical protein
METFPYIVTVTVGGVTLTLPFNTREAAYDVFSTMLDNMRATNHIAAVYRDSQEVLLLLPAAVLRKAVIQLLPAPTANFYTGKP